MVSVISGIIENLMLYLKLVTDETKRSLNMLSNAELSIQVKSLLKQMTAEINRYIEDGDWDFAVKLSSYRHEFAKTHNNHDWYLPFLEIRKMRDIISLTKVTECTGVN